MPAAARIAPVSVEHYENFPVASWLCPPPMRAAVTAIYHFARTADDIADEGDAPAAQRLADLQRYRQALQACAAGQVDEAHWPAVFQPLRQALVRHALPVPLLDDLLAAFMQDTGNPLYADRVQLLDYCRRSANPVGRLLLHLAGIGDPVSLAQSDAICSALQLINFWQDLSVDLPRGRHYVTDADLAAHGLSRNALQPGHGDQTAALVRTLCLWADGLMREGAPLALRVPGRLGWELRLVVQGGLRILERIAAMDYRSLDQRPVLGKTDLPVLLWRALRMQATAPAPGLQLP
jgi:squalene synthase HpnC